MYGFFSDRNERKQCVEQDLGRNNSNIFKNMIFDYFCKDFSATGPQLIQEYKKMRSLDSPNPKMTSMHAAMTTLGLLRTLGWSHQYFNVGGPE